MISFDAKLVPSLDHVLKRKIELINKGLNIAKRNKNMSTGTAKIVTKGTRWSPELSQKAARDFNYIKADEKGGRLFLSGAPNRWKKDPSNVYLPTERLTGTPADVEAILRTCGNYTEAQIRQAMANAYTYQNVMGPNPTKKMDYDRELEQAKNSRPKSGQKSGQKEDGSNSTLKLSEINDVLKQIPGAKKVTGRSTKNATPKTTQSTDTATTGRRGRRVPIFERISKLGPNKVLDVSHMTDDGSGIKMIDRPKQTSAKIEVETIRGCPAFPVVSSDFSKYEAIIRHLREKENHPEFEPYIAAYREKAATRNTETKSTDTPAAPTSSVAPTIPSVPSVVSNLPSMSAPAAPSRPVGPGPITIPSVPTIQPLKAPGPTLPMPKLPSYAGLNLPRSPIKK